MTAESRQQETMYQMPYVAEWERAKGALRAMIAMRGMYISGPERYEQNFRSPADKLRIHVDLFIKEIEADELHYMPVGP